MMLENIILTEKDKNFITCDVNENVYLNNIRQLNPDEYVEIEIDGNKIKVLSQLLFSVFMGAHCNSKCPFCFNKILFTNKNTKHAFFENKIPADEFVKRFDSVYNQLKAQLDLKPFIMLTGGEPVINPLFVPFTQHLLEKRIRYDLLTNGTVLDAEYEGKSLLDIMAPNCGGMQISRVHYDDDINQKIMNLQKKVTNDTIFKAVEKMHKIFNSPYHVGISCMLLKEGIHTINDIKKFIETYLPLNLSVIVFRQMVNIFEYTSDGKNDIEGTYDEIKEELEKDPDFRLDHVKNINGYYNYNYWYKEKYPICFSVPSSKEEMYLDNKICDHIDLYPDGKVYYSNFYSLPVK